MILSQEDTIISGNGSDMQNNKPSNKPGLKKMLVIAVVILLVVVLIGGIFLLINKFSTKKIPVNNQPVAISSSTNATGSLPVFSLPLNATTTGTTTAFSDIAIEYLTFSDFYKAPDNTIIPRFSDYTLPVNVKIDVSNYYDLSRKLSLDPALDNLSKNGFSTIANPWEIEATDFYSVYSKLESKQVPILITSDFILYYYQNILKKVYKDIEENIFYDNLWSITKDIYESAKNRYEARLASLGAVNDSILEGERLEVAFFAVALELLTPDANQILPQGTPDDNNKFLATEANKFYFVTPSYLSDDVVKEIKLIRAAKEQTKSPIMLYSRDYKDFVVSADYRSNAKLNNFYLASRWLNSVFPLNYKDKNCPNCLLDKEDWRLSMIAASLISTDFSNSPELKNKWARIYKVMSYFNPLREDLNYVYYRDAIKSIFGENYSIEELFNDSNPEVKNNFQKLREKLNAVEFSPFLGAIAKNDPAVNSRVGFKMLVGSYSPNDYIFKSLTSPSVTTYQGNAKPTNITSCKNKNNTSYYRCNGIALDIVNLLQPIANNSYFDDNTNYLNYKSEVKKINDKLNKDVVWHMNNYWSMLATISAYLNTNKADLPTFSRSLAWRDQTINTAASAWINMQLPLDKFSVNQNSSSFSRFSDNLYVEPNLNLVNELLANNAMMVKMFSALQVDSEVLSVPSILQAANNNLTALKEIITKELTGQVLSEEDNKVIGNFAGQFIIEKTAISQKQLVFKTSAESSLVEDLSHLKLMVLMHQDGDSKVFSVGPVWDYRETR